MVLRGKEKKRLVVLLVVCRDPEGTGVPQKGSVASANNLTDRQNIGPAENHIRTY
jgi:hypothetical protein